MKEIFLLLTALLVMAYCHFGDCVEGVEFKNEIDTRGKKNYNFGRVLFNHE